MYGGMPPHAANCSRRSTASMRDLGRPPVPDVSISISSCDSWSTTTAGEAAGACTADRTTGLLGARRLGWDGLRCGEGLWVEVDCFAAVFLTGRAVSIRSGMERL